MPGYLLHGVKELPQVEKHGILGVKWTKSSTSLTRTDDAVGLTFEPQIITSTGLSLGSSDFNDHVIYKNIKRCNIVNGLVTAYEGEEGFSMTPEIGDVMVEIPRFYYKVTDTDTELSIQISDAPFDGSEISPMHRPVYGNLQGEEKAYVSAYFLDENGHSSGKPAALSSTISLPTKWPDAGYGNGWIPSGTMTYSTIMLLYLVEVANFNSQTAVCDVGLSSDTDINGKSDQLGYHTGGSEVDNWCVYRGIENLWGKTPMGLWGTLMFETTNLLYKESPWNDNVAETSIKTPLGITAGDNADTGSGYITAFGVDTDVPGVIVPTTTSSTAGAIPDQYITSGLGDSMYLTMYWGAVSSVPTAPSAQSDESVVTAVPESDTSVSVGESLTPLGAGGIFSLVSALNLDCFYRLTYLPALSQRKSFTATFTDRDGETIETQEVSAFYPFATKPAENPTWDKGFFRYWMPDPRLSLMCDTVFEPNFVMGQEEKLPVLGRYDSLEALQAAVTSPTQGDLYEVGTEPPYKVYIYVNSSGWTDTGLTQD